MDCKLFPSGISLDFRRKIEWIWASNEKSLFFSNTRFPRMKAFQELRASFDSTVCPVTGQLPAGRGVRGSANDKEGPT